jgi:hypothetical protein
MEYKPITESELLGIYPELADITGKTVKHTLPNGVVCFLRKNKFHNGDGPAIIHPNGFVYFHNGQKHREDDLPASKNGTRLEWYYWGKCHRISKPAVEDADNQVHVWMQNDLKHRRDLPAVVHTPRGYVAWWVEGKRHRVDGPARIFSLEQRVEWWMHGEMLTEDEVSTIQKMAIDYRQWPKYISHPKLKSAAEFFRGQNKLDDRNQYDLAASLLKGEFQ